MDSFPLLPLLTFHRFLNIPKKHFRNTAGGSTQNGKGFVGVEVYHMGEVIRQKMLIRIVTAPLHSYESNTVFYGSSEPDLQIQIIQFLQKTTGSHQFQIPKIVRKIIRNGLLGRFRQGLNHVHGLNIFSKAIAQRFLYSFFIPLLHLPEGDIAVEPTVGICQVEYIPQLIGGICIHQKCNALGAPVDPPAQLIPGVYIGTGDSPWLLRMDQKLILKAVFIGVRCGGKECHVLFAIGDNAFRFIRCHGNNDLILTGHLMAPPLPVL